MSKRTCSLQDCVRPHKGHGYCRLHLDRLKRYGDVNRGLKHGLCSSPEYRAWSHMKERCSNIKAQEYESYGGRGIKVCERWLKFENFYADMGDRPSNKHSLDRIDNDGNYEPDNCRWATGIEQVLNRRTNKNNTSGYKGVSFDKRKGRWTAQMSVNYKHVFLGYFDDPEQAHEVYLEATELR